MITIIVFQTGMIQNAKNRTFYHARQKQKNSQLDILQRFGYSRSDNGSDKNIP